MTTTLEPKVKVIKDENGLYRGYIYTDGKQLERTNAYFSQTNCITYLNQRVDYWNERKNLNIPKYVQEQQNAST